MTAISISEPVSSFPPAALLAVTLAGRYGPRQHHRHDGFLHHVFATSPWLGAIVIATIVLAALGLAVIKKAGRVLAGIPWYARLVLLATASFGIFRLVSRKKQAGGDRIL